MTEEFTYVFPRVMSMIYGVTAGVCLGLLPVMVAARDSAFPSWGAVVIGVPTLVGAWRGATVRAASDGQRIIVRNVFRTCAVRWTDVTRVHERSMWWSRMYARYACLHVRGRHMPVQVMATTHCGLEQSRRDSRIMAAIRPWQSRLGS